MFLLQNYRSFFKLLLNGNFLLVFFFLFMLSLLLDPFEHLVVLPQQFHILVLQFLLGLPLDFDLLPQLLVGFLFFFEPKSELQTDLSLFPEPLSQLSICLLLLLELFFEILNRRLTFLDLMAGLLMLLTHN